MARHLEACARCREQVSWIRGVVAAAREPGPRAPRRFDVVTARIAGTQPVLLPVDDSFDERLAGPPAGRGRSFPPARRWLVAAGLAAVLAAAVVLTRAPEAGAEKSELWFLPEKPTPGATIAVHYRATARLAGEDRLVVRARYRTAGPGAQPRTVEIGELRSGGADRFEGRITLPDSAVYLVLAVEDRAATFVDDHGERWEVILHDDDGRPLFEALRHRYYDVRDRDTRVAEEVLHTMVELYPDEPEGPYFLHGTLSSRLARDQLDSLRAEYLADLPRLEAALGARGEASADNLWYLAMHANALRDTQTRDRLRRELHERFPTDGATLQQAAFMAAERHRGDPRGRLAALDSVWQLGPDVASQAAFDAWNVARELGDPASTMLWADRLEASSPRWQASIGLQLVSNPDTREAGMTRLRAGIRNLDGPGGERPLGRTAAEHAADRRRQAGTYLAALGSALHAVGRSVAALDTLDRALDTGWNTILFRAVGDARLEVGDTVGALHAFARLAADPNTTAAFVDSVAARLNGANELDEGWEAAVAAGRAELRRELLDISLNRAPLRTRIRLQRPDGETHELRLDEPGLTVVAFWSRYCPPSRAGLPALDAAARRLGRAGVRFVGVTDELDGDAVATFLHENELTMPVFLDTHREASNAFDNRGWPHYVVLDKDGRIRFTSNTAEDILRHVAVLGGPWDP